MPAPRVFLTLLEKQGLAVCIVIVVIAWASGWIPFRLCEATTSLTTVIQSMEKDRKETAVSTERDRLQFVGAIKQIADTMTEQAKATARMDARDAIKTCASIPDKDARFSCIQVAVTGK